MIALLSVLVGASFAGASPLAYYDFEGSDGGLVDVYAGSDIPQWAWGPVRNGPDGGVDGRNAWATGLDADYLNDSTNCLTVPVPSLVGAAHPTLTFSQWYAIADGDAAALLVDDGSGWTVATPVYGYPTAAGWSGEAESWALVGFDLSPYGPSPQVCLRFTANGDGAVDDGWFVDNLGIWDGDVVPPRVGDLPPLPDTEDLHGPYAIVAEVEDDVAVTGATVHWLAGGGAEQSAAMTDLGGGEWAASLPGQPPDTQVDYWVVASDGVNETRSPATGAASFRVYLPAPTDLDGPDGRVVATTASLSWSPPVSTHAVTGYALYRNDAYLRDVDHPPADVPLTGGLDTFYVRALYAEGTGDPSESITVDGVLPVIESLSPAEGFRGDVLRLTVTGENLLLTDDRVQASFGDGVSVTGVEVRDVDLAVLSVEVADDADAGAYDLSLTTPVGTLVAPSAFSVRDDADRPRLTSVTPTEAHQGDTVSLTVAYVGTLLGTPTVDAGDGVVVGDVVVDAAAQTVSLSAAVATNAPLGEHAVTLDDGTRLYTGASFEVLDVAIDPGKQCGLGVGGGSGALVLAGALAALRRRRSDPARGPSGMVSEPRRS